MTRNRVDIRTVADLLERLIDCFMLGDAPSGEDIDLARQAIREFRAPPSASELQELCGFADDVRHAARQLSLQNN